MSFRLISSVSPKVGPIFFFIFFASHKRVSILAFKSKSGYKSLTLVLANHNVLFTIFKALSNKQYRKYTQITKYFSLISYEMRYRLFFTEVLFSLTWFCFGICLFNIIWYNLCRQTGYYLPECGASVMGEWALSILSYLVECYPWKWRLMLIFWKWIVCLGDE